MTTPKATETLMPDAAGITRAARLLAAGATVAFPTETVYGLGADGSLRWQVRTEGGIETSPAISGAGAFVNSLDGRLYTIR